MSDIIPLSDKERKRPFVCLESLKNLKSIITENIASNYSLEKSNERKFPNDHWDEIETKKRKESQLSSNRNVSIEYVTKSEWNNLSSQRIVTLKEQDSDDEQNLEQSNIKNTQTALKRIVIPSSSLCDNEQVTDEHEAANPNGRDSMIIPHLSSFSSMCSFDSSSSFNDIQPLLSLPVHSSTHTNQEFTIPQRQIITSCKNQENALENNDFTSPYLANNENSDHLQPTVSIVHIPTQESHSLLSSELFDCCESHQRSQSNENNSEYWDSFHTSTLIRETMINISKRLIKTESIPIVDTHCHFDLIFDRLYITHDNPTTYFDDYKDFYPSGLSFELAIHVFWRPRHLTENNWRNRYSKYLNDERVYGSCGIHPHWSSAWRESFIEDIERCLTHPKIVAIGEIGLDFGPKNTCNIDMQCRVFSEQLKLATKWRKPIVIHSRNAYQQTFNIMKQFLTPDHKIHLHCFVGTMSDIQLFTSYFNEIKFGFTPIISRGNFLHQVIEQLDLKQILSETDSPYFIPKELSHLSRCAHPGMVYSVVETIAQIQRLSIDDVAYQLRENARQIYGV